MDAVVGLVASTARGQHYFMSNTAYREEYSWVTLLQYVRPAPPMANTTQHMAHSAYGQHYIWPTHGQHYL